MRRAVIDIGTNSVKLLVADVQTGEVVPLWEGIEQTRLGQGFYETHQLQPGPMSKTANAVAQFAAKAKEWHATTIRVIATSAVRDATNQAELVEAVRSASGFKTEVISGEQEADWVYAGVRSDPVLLQGALLIVDVGGGSTEFILGQGPHPSFRQSFPVGTVRLAEQIRVSDPPTANEWERCRTWLDDFLRHQVSPALAARLREFTPAPVSLVGTGGTTAIIGAMELALERFDRDRLEHARLPRHRVGEHQKLLWNLALAERRNIRGLPANRADVILFGVAIFAVLMEVFQFDELRVSTRGLRFGAITEGATTP